MKKLLVVSLLTCLATGVFAFDLSAGGGVTVGSFSSTYYYEDIGPIDSLRERSCTVPFAISGYFDATYALAAIGFRANGNTRTSYKIVSGGTTTYPAPSDDHYAWGFLSFSVLGKYPFAVGPVTIFPLAGIEYDAILYRHDETGATLSTEGLGQFWFRIGAGSDITVYRNLYIRPIALFGLKLLNADEKKKVQDTLDAGASLARITDFAFDGGVQVGWRF